MSERDRFSLIGHAGMPLMNPLRTEELVLLLDAARLGRGERVLDLGGGRGDLARLAVTRCGCVATSVDRSPAACEEARARTPEIEVVCQDAVAFLEVAAPREVALAAALGALHAFGSGLPSWTAALDTLAPRARQVLVGDLVALDAAAASEMDVATMAQLAPLFARATARITLGPDRVLAYERAWCDAIAAFLAAHPSDPRAAWAEERIAWSRAPERDAAWRELAFIAMLVPGEAQAGARGAALP